MAKKFWYLGLLGLLLVAGLAAAEEDGEATVEEDIGKSRDASRTDDEAVAREGEAIQLEGLSVKEMQELRDRAEKHTFQAEVDRMMKLIINSLYKNKEIFLRELISNSSDALDKIRFLSLTDKNALAATEELSVKIKVDKDHGLLHITDTGIGMTKNDMVTNLGTIAKSGTSDFLTKISEAKTTAEMNDLIGQFGVGFYSSFLVSDSVVVTSKHNDDDQYVWESDSSSFTVTRDPRGNTLGRGTCVTLKLKEEAHDYLEQNTIKDLVKKYSQFINFNIYLWDSKVIKEPVPQDDDDAEKKDEDADAEKDEEKDDDAAVEEVEEEKPEPKTVDKTVWDWVLVNDNKPLWTRKPSEISDEEYNEFYKSFSKDGDAPMTRTHFTAEGEVTFKSVLFIPEKSPSDMFNNYGKNMEFIKMYVRRVFITDDFKDMMPKYLSFVRGVVTFKSVLFIPVKSPQELFNNYGKRTDLIKMYVRRVFITDNFEDMMPKYLAFVKGVVDSDDLPLNVSRETLQQHKLLKVIKKKLVRKTLDMIKKIADEDYDRFWKEYSTNIKLGVIEDHSNRTRLAKLLRFFSSNSETEQTSLQDYVERMKEKQENIFFMAGTSREEVENSPFVESLLKKGYEVLYLTEPVDEYCIQALPEFDGKKFQNVAKEGLKMDQSGAARERKEALDAEYKPLLEWLKDNALGGKIEKAKLSDRLQTSPSALVASNYGWSGNMERIMRAQAYQKSQDPSQQYYQGQKKILELNPRHPLVKKLKERYDEDSEDDTTKDIANMLYETATLRSGFILPDTASFAERIERMMRLSMDIPLDEPIEEEPEDEEDEELEEDEEEVVDEEGGDEEGGDEDAGGEEDAGGDESAEEDTADSHDEL